MSTPILGNLHIVLAGFLFKIFFNSPSTTPRYTIYCTGVRFWNHPVLNPSCFLLFGLHLCVSILPFSHFWHGASRIKKTPDSNHLGAIIPTIGRIPNNKPQIGNGFLLILGDATKTLWSPFQVEIPNLSIFGSKKDHSALGHLTSHRCSRSIEDDHD